MPAPIHDSCDQALVRSTRSEATASHPRLVLATCILASGLAFVDGSVVNIGLPAIGHGFAATAGGLQWIVNAYLLPLSALLLLGGAAGDRYGRRTLLIAGTTLFAVASLGCAVAPHLAFLLASRLFQGVGAAMLMPSSLALLGATFSGQAKGRAIGIWAATGAATAALGPMLGGWLIDLGSWRAIFMLNLPLAAGAVALAWGYVPPDRNGQGGALDWIGGALATLALGASTWALTLGSGREGWTGTAIVAALAAILLALVFVWVEARQGDGAMMPLVLFASRSFVGLTLLTFLLYGALGCLFVLFPYMLIEGAQYSGSAAGAALLPLPVILAATSPMMGSLAGRIGSRLPLTLGPLVVAGGFLLALRIDADARYWTQVLPSIVLIAIGMSGAVAPLTTAVLNAVEDRRTGSASGFNSAVARTGGLVATAILGSVLAATGVALVTAFHVAMVVGAGVCVAASLSAFGLIERAADRKNGP